MANTQKTTVDPVVAELVNSTFQKFLIQEGKLIPTVQNFEAPAGYDKVKVPRATAFTTAAKAGGTALTPQVLTYATDDLDLDQHQAIAVRIEDIADVQAMPGIVSDAIERMAKQLVLSMDEYIVTKLEEVSTAAPDHKIAYDNAATLGKVDILEARRLLHIQNVPFNECFIGVSPGSEKALLAIDDFVHADKYGSAEGLRNGELGRLYGAPVIMSNVFDDLKTMVWHPSHVGFARQIEMKFEQDRQSLELATDYVMSNLYGAMSMDSGKRAVLLGTAV